MGNRETKKAGISKTRHPDAGLQKTLDSIIERVEVLDGLRGDALDQAVTYRDLEASNFPVTFGSGGNPQVGSPPTGGDGGGGPVVGPTTAPSNLAAAETFLALLLTWINPSFNLQHIQVWRGDTDNLSLATLIGTTVAPMYVDYVGASASFYYWVRAVATDGTFSPYNATAGVLGTTGVDPSDFEVNLNISSSNLDAALSSRIDLIDIGDGILGPLWDRVGTAEGDIVDGDARTTVLEGSVAGLGITVDGHTTSISGNASNISTNTAGISTLVTDLDLAEGAIGTNTVSITANASSILNLEATVGALDAEGGETWEFIGVDEGFTAVNATQSLFAQHLEFTPTAPDPQFISPTIALSGGIYTQVVVRVRQSIGGGSWEGNCYYETSGHGASSSYVKTIPNPGLVLSEWTTLTWDMSDLTAGGTDWVNSTITKIRLDLVSDSAGRFDIDWVLIAKFSTTALTEAIDALDVRVTVNESGISAQGTRLTVLEATVDDVDNGVVANATAIDAIIIDVGLNVAGISSNAGAITALQSTVNDGTSGVVANASAITILETDVSTIDGVLTSQSGEITQLVASIGGGFASMVNSLQRLNEAFGTSFVDGDIQNYSDLGGRTGVAARQPGSTNVTETVYQGDGTRLKIEPRGVYEVKFSIYHHRPTSAGTFFIGLEAYAALTGGSAQNVTPINDFLAGTPTSSPYWLSGGGTTGAGEWLDVTCYIIGPDVLAPTCPNMSVNGETDNTVLLYQVFNDGFQTSALNPYVEFKLKNFNASPTYGDDTTTTLYTTDLQVRRVDSTADLYAALEVESTVRAEETGDLNALYSVKVELSTGGDPYITGFGLAADVIDGVATSAFGIAADQFYITSPTFGSAPGGGPGDNVNSSFPFIVDLVEGVATVAINGQLIVDGTIRAESIVAESIGADRIAAMQLSAISADIGIITAGLFRTAASPAFRVEMEDQASTPWPLWYGSGAKGAGGLFYVTQNGDVVVKGLLDAGMIKQSYFTPSTAESSFRIACDYPANYSGGVYTGKKAHLAPVISINETPRAAMPTYSTAPYYSGSMQFYGPAYAGTLEYGRLGSTSEIVNLDAYVTISAAAVIDEFLNPPRATITTAVTVQYKYDSEPWNDASITDIITVLEAFGTGGGTPVQNAGTATFSMPFITKGSAFDTVAFRLKIGRFSSVGPVTGTLETISLRATSYNFGISDLTTTPVSQTSTTDPVEIDQVPRYPRYLPPGTLPP